MLTIIIYVIIPSVIIGVLIFLIYLGHCSLKSYLKSYRQEDGSPGKNTGMFFSLVHMIVIIVSIILVLSFFIGFIGSCSVGLS
jgi:hypothetical protein